MKLFWRFWPFARPYRLQLLAALLAMLARPALNTAKLWLLKVVIDQIGRAGQVELLGPICLAYLGIALAKALVAYFDDYLASWVGSHISLDIRTMLYRHLQNLSLRFYNEWPTGEIMTRLSGDINAIEDLLVTGLTDLIGHLVTIILFMAMLFYIDAKLTLVALIVLPFLGLAVYNYSRKSRAAAIAVRKAAADLNVVAEETLSNVSLIKAFAREEYAQDRFGKVTARGQAARLAAARIRAFFQPLSDIAATVAAVAVLWVGVLEMQHGAITLGGLIVFTTYLGALYTPIQGLSRLSNTFQVANAGAERVVELLEIAPELTGTTRVKSQGRFGMNQLDPIHLPEPVQGLLEFENVTFSYDPDTAPVLRDFSLKVRPGEAVAIVGPSGAGKTTLTNLLLRFYDPDSGVIRIDGYNLREITPVSLRQNVAIVMQNPQVFHATIADNIRFGCLDASDAEVEQAGAAAQIDSFVRASPKGYSGVVGQRGGKLSGGQKQRLTIARAFVKNAPILVLDEATSALDSLTELQIRRELTRLMTGRTTLIIAHRLSTVRYVPRIVVLDEGQLVEQGSHQELMALKGLYFRLYSTQAEEEADATKHGTLAPN